MAQNLRRDRAFRCEAFRAIVAISRNRSASSAIEPGEPCRGLTGFRPAAASRRNRFPTRGDFATLARCLPQNLPRCLRRFPAPRNATLSVPQLNHEGLRISQGDTTGGRPVLQSDTLHSRRDTAGRQGDSFRAQGDTSRRQGDAFATRSPPTVSHVSTAPPPAPPSDHVHSFAGKRDCSGRGGFPYPGSHEARDILRPIHGLTHGTTA